MALILHIPDLFTSPSTEDRLQQIESASIWISDF